MLLDPDTLEQLRDAERALRPDSAALERTRAKYHARVEASATPPRARRTPRRRSTWLVGGATVAALAAAGWAFLAIAPDREGDHRLDAASASAALKRAASASAEEPWTPLAPGEFHHVYSIEPLVPDIPTEVLEDIDRPTKDVNELPTSSFGESTSTESWFDLRGRGFVVSAMGSRGYADEFPDFGEGGSYGFQDPLPARPKRSLGDQLRYGNALSTTSYPDDGEPSTSRSWTRAREAYQPGRVRVAGSLPFPGRSFEQRVQLQYWGATYADIERTNSAEPDERRRATLTLLDDPRLFRERRQLATEDQMVNAGRFGETDRTIRAKFRVEQAVKLLARAPLAPTVRRELFLILADQPFVTSTGGATDELGRRGTQVTFLTKFDGEIPAERVSLDTVRREGLRQGFTAKQLASLSGEPYYDVPAHDERRTWFIQVIFDEQTGELLQEKTYETARTELGRPRPRMEKPGGRMIVVEDKMEMAGSGSTVYVSRERAESVSNPLSPVCENEPKQMCSYTG